jgi:hypothetical protein
VITEIQDALDARSPTKIGASSGSRICVNIPVNRQNCETHRSASPAEWQPLANWAIVSKTLSRRV